MRRKCGKFQRIFLSSQVILLSVSGFLINSRQRITFQCNSVAEDLSHEYIRFSRAFQRHVVYSKSNSKKNPDYKCDRVVESFLFLDEAIDKYPLARIEPLEDIGCRNENEDPNIIIAGMGIIPSSSMQVQDISMESKELETIEYLVLLALGGSRTSSSRNMENMKRSVQDNLIRNVAPSRIKFQNPSKMIRNYDKLIDLLTRGRARSSTSSEYNGTDSLILGLTKSGLGLSEIEARSVISSFPQLCLYDLNDLENKLRFFLAPFNETIWLSEGNRSTRIEPDYLKIMQSGYGVGLTMEQATKIVRLVPQFLSLYHEDSKKASIIYFYRDLDIPTKYIDAVRSAFAGELSGVEYADIICLGMLHSFGASLEQIRLIISACPTILYPDKEPGWELLENDSTRSVLNVETINYLRQRLQIGVSDVYAMMKTHPRLTSYSILKNIMPTLNALQVQIGLSTRNLRTVALRMPSLIGIGVDNTTKKSALDKHIEFFCKDVGMTKESLREAVLKQPSILQYSVDSTLRPKLHFLLEELHIQESSIERIFKTAPSLLGLSLEHNLRPTIQLLKDKCCISGVQLAGILETVPSILLLSAKSKIDPCLTFLSSELLLSPLELGFMIWKNPRILTHSVERSLMMKLDMIRVALKQQGQSVIDDNRIESICKTIFVSNPALLTTTNSILQKRIERALKDERSSLSQALAPKSTGRKRLYFNEAFQMNPSDTTSNSKNDEYSEEVFNTSTFDLFENKDYASVYAFSTGATFPPDKSYIARGKRKVGSIAIVFPQIGQSNNSLLHEKLKSAMTMSFGRIMPESAGGSNPAEGLVLAGFPFLKSSRSRCGIYAAHGALKVILQLLKQAAAERDLSGCNIDIRIYTDSTYAWKSLKDSEQLLRLGEISMRGQSPENLEVTRINSDLLIPLSKTMYRMVTNNVINRRGEKLIIGKRISVKFLHTGDALYKKLSGESNISLQVAAKNAAIWQFEKKE